MAGAGPAAFEYSGKDNLDLMRLAVNYNNAIYGWIAEGIVLGDQVLEFGAGKGEFCNRIMAAKISAVELDQELHQYIKCVSFRYLSEVNDRYDLIFSSNVLEHIEDDASVVAAFSRLLKKGGRVKVLVPARKELFSNMDETVGHIRRYSRDGLAELFVRQGFSVTSCRYFDFLGYFATLLYKLISNEGAFNTNTILIYDRVIFPVSRLLDALTFGRVIGKNIMLEAVMKQR